MQAIVAIVCSCIVCGSGHFIKGYQKRGLVFFATFTLAIVFAWGFTFFVQNPLSKVGVVGFGILSLWIWMYHMIDLVTLEKSGVPVVINQESEERYRQAMALLIQGNRTDARMIFEQMLKENKADVDCYFQLGKIACEENNLKLAKKHFDRCFRIPGGDKWEAEIHDILESMRNSAELQEIAKDV